MGRLRREFGLCDGLLRVDALGLEVVAMAAGQYAKRGAAAARATGQITLSEVLDGWVGLDITCLDRIHLNAYVPNLQVPGQVVQFLRGHLGNPIRGLLAVSGRVGERVEQYISNYGLVVRAGAVG